MSQDTDAAYTKLFHVHACFSSASATSLPAVLRQSSFKISCNVFHLVFINLISPTLLLGCAWKSKLTCSQARRRLLVQSSSVLFRNRSARSCFIFLLLIDAPANHRSLFAPVALLLLRIPFVWSTRMTALISLALCTSCTAVDSIFRRIPLTNICHHLTPAQLLCDWCSKLFPVERDCVPLYLLVHAPIVSLLVQVFSVFRLRYTPFYVHSKPIAGPADTTLSCPACTRWHYRLSLKAPDVRSARYSFLALRYYLIDDSRCQPSFRTHCYQLTFFLPTVVTVDYANSFTGATARASWIGEYGLVKKPAFISAVRTGIKRNAFSPIAYITKLCLMSMCLRLLKCFPGPWLPFRCNRYYLGRTLTPVAPRQFHPKSSLTTKPSWQLPRARCIPLLSSSNVPSSLVNMLSMVLSL